MNVCPIDALSKDDYKEALLALHPMPEHHLALLGEHYRAANRTITASQLAEKVGYANYNAVNLHYGKLADQICDQVGQRPQQRLHILVTFYRPDDDPHEHWHLVLRPQVVEALDELAWF